MPSGGRGRKFDCFPARPKTRDPSSGPLEHLQHCYNRKQDFVSDTGKRDCMFTRDQYRGLTHNVLIRATFLVVVAAATFIPGWAAQAQTSLEPTSNVQASSASDAHTHMSEALRSSVRKVVVIAGPSPTNQEITGSYEKATPGLTGGMSAGSRIGNPSTEIGGITVNFPIPILTLPVISWLVGLKPKSI